jgi:hypothetical protein
VFIFGHDPSDFTTRKAAFHAVAPNRITQAPEVRRWANNSSFEIMSQIAEKRSYWRCHVSVADDMSGLGSARSVR